MRIVLGVRKQQREQQQKQGEFEENPVACASPQPNSPSPPPVGEDDNEKKKAASAPAAPVSAETCGNSVTAKKQLKTSKKRGRKSPSLVPTAPLAQGEVVPGFHTSKATGKKLPPSQQDLSSEGATGPVRKRKHPPHKSGDPKTGDEVTDRVGVSEQASKKARYPLQQQGRDRKVGADGFREAPCASSSSSKVKKKKMGVGEKYRPREQEAERDGDLVGTRRAESPGPEQDDDPAADDFLTGLPEESGAIDVIRYGDSAIDHPEIRDENDDPAAADLGSSKRQHGAVASSAVAPSSSSSSSSSSLSTSLRRRRRPGGFSIGGERTSSAALSASGPVVTSSASQADFEEALKKRGFEMAEQEGDGNCLFRAVSLQVYGDANNHREVRRRCLDFMARDEEHFSQFITDEPFREYIQRKRQDGVHGNNPEIQAISELYNRPVEVFVPDNGAKPINIFHAEYKTADAPIRLSYHDGNHYNAVVDPLLPTAGLGLGLPGLEPGLADRLQIEKAKEESEIELAAAESSRGEMDRALEESRASVARMYDKQKALAMSDLEATDYELERAVLESSMESYRRTEMGRKQGLPRGIAAASMSSSSSSLSSTHHHHRGRRVPRSASPPTSSSVAYAASAATSSAAVAAPAPPAVAVASAQLDGGAAHRDEYPASVQELVMNGFELSKVLRAYDLVGDNFDALLSVLMSSGN